MISLVRSLKSYCQLDWFGRSATIRDVKKKKMLQTKFNLGNSNLLVRSADYSTIEFKMFLN